MEQNWFLHVQGVQYGPYPFEELRRMVQTGQVRPDTMVFHASLGNWTAAAQVNGLFQTATTYQPPKKKGCFRVGCLFFVLIFVGIAAFFTLRTLKIIDPPRPNNMKLEKAVVVGKDTLDQGGDELVIKDGSQIDGFKIEMPADAYDKDTKFTVSTQSIGNHKFGENFNPITPLIHVNNGGKYANAPMTVTIPIEKADNEFALAFYYTKQGTLEALPLVYEDNTQIIVATDHFSDVVVSKVDEALLKNVSIDTGFIPGVDDWSFVNRGSAISKSGHCAGQTISMAYYYFEKKLKGAPALFGAYDNNHEILKTPGLDRDDSMGIRLASMVQESVDWNAITREYTRQYGVIDKYIPDKWMYYAFAYAMLITKEPQYMGINVRSVDAAGKVKLEFGHAILAYKITGDKIFVADPNFPGAGGRFVPFDGTNFGVYESKTNADNPGIMYNAFALYAKSALVNWSSIGTMFDEIDKSAVDSSIGDAKFPTTHFTVYTSFEENAFVKAENPEVVQIEAAGIQSIRDNSAKLGMNVPADFNQKDYLVLEYRAQVQKGELEIYAGSKMISKQALDATDSYVFIPIEKGMNDIGIYYKEWIAGPVVNNAPTGKLKFIDFVRFDVVNGEEDLTGTWEGTMSIKEFGKVKDYAQKVGVEITKFLVNTFLKELIKTPISDQQIEEAVASSIEVNPDIYKPMPVTLILEKKEDQKDKKDSKTYTGTISTTTSEGIVGTYPVTATYEKQYLTLEITAEDGSKLEFKYGLYDNKTLAGTFKINAWGMIESGVTGESTLIKK